MFQIALHQFLLVLKTGNFQASSWQQHPRFEHMHVSRVRPYVRPYHAKILSPFLCTAHLLYIPKIQFTQATIDCLNNNKTKNVLLSETVILNYSRCWCAPTGFASFLLVPSAAKYDAAA